MCEFIHVCSDINGSLTIIDSRSTKNGMASIGLVGNSQEIPNNNEVRPPITMRQSFVHLLFSRRIASQSFTQYELFGLFMVIVPL